MKISHRMRVTRDRIFSYVRFICVFRQHIKRYRFGISTLGGKGVPCYSTPHCENYLCHSVILSHVKRKTVGGRELRKWVKWT